MELIYLDNNATTRPAAEAIQAASQTWTGAFANPSSQHLAGQTARLALEQAREEVATLVGAKPREIIFTSGGTEADNLAILGVLAANPTRRHLVTTTVEHPAIRDLVKRLEKDGLRVSWIGVDGEGRLDMAALAGAICGETALVSVMHANNETGVFFPISEISALTRAAGVPLHVDAVQTAGRTPVDVDELGADLLTVSAHKMHGLKGAGALYVRTGMRMRGVLTGGHQERDLRPGTEAMPAIVAFGAAARLAAKRFSDADKIARLRDRLENGILDCVSVAAVNGGASPRVPHTTSIAFRGLSAEAILIGLSQSGVCASSGSACTSGALKPSHVLQAMGLDDEIVMGPSGSACRARRHARKSTGRSRLSGPWSIA